MLLGNRKVALNITSWTDASNLEPGDEKRQIRGNLSMTVRAWLPRDFVRVPILHTIQTEILDISTQAALSSFNVPTP